MNEGDGLKNSLRLLEDYRRILIKMLPKRKEELEAAKLLDIKKQMEESEETTCLFLRTIIAVLQLYFKDIHKNIQRIELVRGVKSMGRGLKEENGAI